MAPFDLAPDPSGFSRAPSDAVGVGGREAFGVRQLAAALFPCPNNVPVPIPAFEGFLHRLRQPRTGTRDNLQGTPQSGTRTQTTSLSVYPTPPKGRSVVAALLAAREPDTKRLTNLAA
ncbi:MAG: hypothetical protein GX456_00490 [Verrucomicrobia bacterium]|nr:hypothetical protein [Verrucomicrobiota bacterium]